MLKATMGKVLLKEDSHIQNAINLILSDPDATRDVSSGVIISKGSDNPNASRRSLGASCDAREGDRVAYRSKTIMKNDERYNLNEFVWNGERYVSVDFEDILAVYG